MPLRPVANPPNPWATTDIAYEAGEAPDARVVTVVEHTQSREIPVPHPGDEGRVALPPHLAVPVGVVAQLAGWRQAHASAD